MIKAFPKIFAIGTDYIRDIFDGPVEITEKIDGSQFDFGKVNGELYMRSKGKIQYAESPDKMFLPAVNYVQSIEHTLPEGMVFYCEYLRQPKHNTLAYERIPTNHLMLFGVTNDAYSTSFVCDYHTISDWAAELGVEPVPVMADTEVTNITDLAYMLNRESVLGKSNIEGIVVKNYSKQFLLGGQPMPLMAGKFVSEKFKEVHRSGWSREHTSGGKWEAFKEGFRTEARWDKAIQHLAESGELDNEPKDIGKLIKEIQRDIIKEEQDYIKDFLFKHFGQDVLRKSIAGFPEYYKQKLAERSFEVQP